MVINKLLGLALIMLLGLQSSAQQMDSVKTSASIAERTATQRSIEPLIVIDGNKQYIRGLGAANSISPSDIASVNVLKDASATHKYGLDGTNGVIEIQTKNGLSSLWNKSTDTASLTVNDGITGLKFEQSGKPTIFKRNLLQKDSDPKAKRLYIVNGLEKNDIDDIAPNTIESITVLKGASATTSYQDKGKNGVIIITTKAKIPAH